MPRSTHTNDSDNPYRDESAPSAPVERDSSSRRPPDSAAASNGRSSAAAREGTRPARGRGGRARSASSPPASTPAVAAKATPATSAARKSEARPVARSGQRPQVRERESTRPEGRPRRRRRGGGAYAAAPQLTSVSTSRTAYTETRIWLLEQHGPVCAYCGGRFTSDVMTLDHVAPRRGLTAYDRRDNLVLACSPCNALKADKAPIAFLLGSRTRAVNMLRYGQHLSPMLIELASSLAPGAEPSQAERDRIRREFERWADLDEHVESPYR